MRAASVPADIGPDGSRGARRMLTVRSFDTLAEAARAAGPRARYLAGGTLVMRAVNYGDQGFDTILRSADPELRAIRAEGGGGGQGGRCCENRHGADG